MVEDAHLNVSQFVYVSNLSHLYRYLGAKLQKILHSSFFILHFFVSLQHVWQKH